jgi:hypothetical protein
MNPASPTEENTNTSIFSLPLELVENIILELDPLELSPLAQTCRYFHNFIYHTVDSHLWRNLHLLQELDDPRRCLSSLLEPVAGIDWQERLKRITRAQVVATSPHVCKPHEREDVLHTLLDLASVVPPMPSTMSEDISLNQLWVAAILRGGELLDNDHWELSQTERQLRAHLHTMYGLTPRDATRAGRYVEPRIITSADKLTVSIFAESLHARVCTTCGNTRTETILAPLLLTVAGVSTGNKSAQFIILLASISLNLMKGTASSMPSFR